MCARTVIARVTGSTREPTVRTVPSNSRSGKLTLFATTLAPGVIVPTNVSGTVKSSLMIGDVVDRRDRRVRAQHRAGADLAETEHAAERCQDQPIAQPRDDAVEARLLAPARERATSSSEAEVKAAAAQVLQPAQLTLRIVEIRARFGEQRFLFLIRELDQHGAGLDVVAVLEVHAAHGVRDLRGQRDRLVRLRRAERLDDVVELIAARAPDGHERRLSLRPSAAGPKPPPPAGDRRALPRRRAGAPCRRDRS